MGQELSSTVEDYLEAIFRIEQKKHFARVRDIAETLGVAKSTATAALKTLHGKGLINYKPYEPATLSPRGRESAERIVLRHRILKRFLQHVLDIKPQRADSVACRMEHAIDSEALEQFVCFLAFIKQYGPEEMNWLQQFRHFVKEGADGKACRECIETYINELQES